jgi:5-methylcytosine-specific restriction endonuclease McrA
MEALTGKEARIKWKQSIKDSWNNCCAYCGKPPIDDSSLTLDHVKAKCKGGEDLTANIVPADKICNLSKGSSDWRTWFRKQIFYDVSKELRIDHWLKTGNVLELQEIIQLYGHINL